MREPLKDKNRLEQIEKYLTETNWVEWEKK
jgi:hypothetical protein